MKNEFRKAIVPADLRSLVLFDHKAFHEYPGDWFPRDHWRIYETWWMLVDGKKVGCCAFEPHVDFQDDLEETQENPALSASLYIASTGILPQFRRQGLGSLLKCWQIAYARHHGFNRIVTNTRASNLAMIGLNRKFGFRIIRKTAGYYAEPPEPTVVMARSL